MPPHTTTLVDENLKQATHAANERQRTSSWTGPGRHEQPKNKPLVGRMRFFFKNPIVDAYFSYVLAFGARGGGDVGEAYFAASRIRQYKPETWVQAFTEMAERLVPIAERAMERGHRVSARETWLRASFLDRAALMSLSPMKHAERYRSIRARSLERFQKAAELFDPPIERISIPFDGIEMKGYFIRPDLSETRRKTLIVVGGGDSLVEDMVFVFGLGIGERSYNFLSVDLPGQGDTPLAGMKMTPDSERPMKAVVDYALSRPEVDSARLAAVGGSLGGYIVPRAAIHDDRIKAIVVNSLILNLYEYFVQAKELKTLARLEGMPGFRILLRLSGSWLAGLFNVMDTWKWKWGVDTIAEWLEVSKAYEIDPSGIRCPTLLLIGEDEYAFEASRRFQKEALDRINHPRKELVIGSGELGAGGKNFLPNLTLFRNTTFDWLDEVFEDQSP